MTLFAVLALVGMFLGVVYTAVTWDTEGVGTVLAILLLVAYFGLPIAVYADVRMIHALEVDWRPKAPFWVFGCLIPFVNVATLVPYLLRRYERVHRRESWDFWWRIAGGVVAFAFLLLVVEIVYYDLLALEYEVVDTALFGAVLVWLHLLFLVPMGVKYDLEYVDGHLEWEPNRLLWIGGSVYPGLNFFVVGAYAAFRNPRSPFSVIDDGTDPSTGGIASRIRRSIESLMSATDGRSSTGTPVGSNWWYFPAITTLLTAIEVLWLVGIAVGFVVGSDWVTYRVLLAFATFIYAVSLIGLISMIGIWRDVIAVREADVGWQPSMSLYLVLVLLTPSVPSALYIFRRHRRIGRP